ncbi:MAG: hypothetical protein QOD53_2400 [Thermoleophilaceae bacterium]|jgi:hypothetical protein|nr:hypothetical protein [Thermoleophilaceae bacterium]
MQGFPPAFASNGKPLKPSKPNLQGVVDLGLRDVGVENDPRRQAAHFGKMVVQLFALVIVSAVVTCALVVLTRPDPWIVLVLGLAWTAGMFVLVFRMVKRSPPVVVKVTAEGTNQATWLMIGPSLLFAVAAVLGGWGALVIPVVVLTAIVVLVAWHGRGRAPEALRELRLLLAADESVLGDGAGLTRVLRKWTESFRLVVATDRRLLVASSPRSTERLLVDVPYERVSRFGVEWKYLGRIGVLSLTVSGVDGAPSETHVISVMAPANLLSIAEALQSHGVHSDDPAAVSQAERAWEEVQRPGKSLNGLLDRAAMDTQEFDRGLWLLLGLTILLFYGRSFGLGIGSSRGAWAVVLLVFPFLCGICGYVSATRSSLAYIVPLNLLIAPVFLFYEAGNVIWTMVVLSAIAAVCLVAGSALRSATARLANTHAEVAASPSPRPARGSLRYTVGGLSLVRLTGMVLAAVVAAAVIASAAGFDLSNLRLAVFEANTKQVPVDGRSSLSGGAASLTYTPGPDLHEFISDQHLRRGMYDGARWELRSSWTKGFNVVSLAHYVFEPPLDNPAAVAAFVARKDRQHTDLAGFSVTHTQLVVHGRRGYVWNHDSRNGYWYYAAWFPQPVHSVRVECIARDQVDRFKRLCTEAMRSLTFH